MARKAIRPIRIRPVLLKERGVWVYRSGKPTSASIPGLIARQRDRRGLTVNYPRRFPQ
jgi:hypothetical protein